MSYYNHRAMNTADYVDYYRSQAGGGLPGYSGGAVMYGAGLRGLFRGLFRMAIPLLKKDSASLIRRSERPDESS